VGSNNLNSYNYIFVYDDYGLYCANTQILFVTIFQTYGDVISALWILRALE